MSNVCKFESQPPTATHMPDDDGSNVQTAHHADGSPMVQTPLHNFHLFLHKAVQHPDQFES